MPVRAAISWLEARGWLVLAGSVRSSEAVRARSLAVAAADGGVAILACAGANEAVEQLLNEFEDLGAQSGYVVDAFVEDDQTLRSRLADAGIVVVGAESDASLVHDVLVGAVSEGIRMAWQHGALVLLEGPAAMSAGSWTLHEEDSCRNGLGWLSDAVILPGVTDVGSSTAVSALLAEAPAAVALGIGPQAALALGPDGELEIWGEQQVSIALGTAWHAS